MKNIFLTDKQVSLLKESLEHITPKNIEELISDARGNGFDMLDDRALKRLLEARYNEIISYFSDDVTQIPNKVLYNKLNKLAIRCTKLEENIRPQLEKICYNTVVQLFDLPADDFKLTCELVDTLDPKHTFHYESNVSGDEEYSDYDEVRNEDNEIKKRKLINCFIAGGATRFVDASRKLYMSELFDLDEELPHLYSKMFKIDALLLFNSKAVIKDEHHMQNGYCKVILRNNDMLNSVESVATNFPSLLYETVRGVLELLASQGLPSDMTTAKRVLDRADILKLDPSNMRIGPALWDILFNDVDSKKVPYIFHNLVSNINSDVFEDVVNEFAFGTRRGSEFVEKLRKMGEYDSEYTNFSNDLLKKQSDISIINDSYFLAEDLEPTEKENKMMALIDCDPSEISFEVGDAQDGMSDIFIGDNHRMEYQLYPVVNGVEFGPEDGINFRAEELTINGEPKYQLHIFVAPELRRNGIASKLYEAFIKQGYPVCSLYNNRVATFNRENGVESKDDSAIENLWKKLGNRGIKTDYIMGDDGRPVGIYTNYRQGEEENEYTE